MRQSVKFVSKLFEEWEQKKKTSQKTQLTFEEKMLFEVKVSEPVAKSVNNKIVQFYPVKTEIVSLDENNEDGDDEVQYRAMEKEYKSLRASSPFACFRRFSQFRELHAFSSTKGARLPPFPPKVLIVSPQHLEERRAAFEQILNTIMNDRTLNALPEVSSFIGALQILENAGCLLYTSPSPRD